MRIFLSLNVTGPRELLVQQQLIQELKKLGVNIITPADSKKGGFDGTGFDGLDALVLDAGVQEAETGYLLAIALANKKPVLYLQRKGTLLDSSIEALAKNKDVGKYIRLSYYSLDSLLRKVKAFLQYLDQNIGRESFSIKYTLRMSPRLDRYLSWKSEKAKKNKADFLRDLVVDLLQNDEEYRGLLK